MCNHVEQRGSLANKSHNGMVITYAHAIFATDELMQALRDSTVAD